MLEVNHQNMLRLVVLIFSIGIQGLVTSQDEEENFDPHENLVLPKENPTENHRTCMSKEVQRFSDAYHNCFIDKKYEDGDKDLDSLVDRILERSRVCIENFGLECRPNLKSFTAMMDKVIHQMRDYSYIYLERMTCERVKIKDLKCVEESLSKEIYQSCFKEVLGEDLDSSEKKFQQKVENATSCMNKSHKLCSRAAKTSLNRMVRTFLRVEQPKKERTEDQLKPELPKKRYNYITSFVVEQQYKEDIKGELKTEPPKKRYDYITSVEVEQSTKEDTKDELKTEPPKKRYDYITSVEVEQSTKEDTKDELKTEPPKKRYDYITSIGVEQPAKEDTKEVKTEAPKKRSYYSSSPKVEQPEKEDIEDELQPAPSKTRYDYIPPLRIEQPEKEDIVDEVNEPHREPQPEPKKKWYHYITKPFIMLWNAVKSFFTC